MTNAEQGYTAWRTEQLRRAQAFTLSWAERAETEYDWAVGHDDYARRQADSAYQHDALAHARRQATFHGVRSTEAARLAEMWSHVAAAFAAGPPPPETITVRGTIAEQDLARLRTQAAARPPGHPV
ncbi:hypothetical protein ABZX40_41335 [Streptomyces sp. NPDC004610]|uniref:hypothetical protein n=1 Tax=unclassified Streptomyces TaxID=2593676 RepID=UPI0033B06A65